MTRENLFLLVHRAKTFHHLSREKKCLVGNQLFQCELSEKFGRVRCGRSFSNARENEKCVGVEFQLLSIENRFFSLFLSLTCPLTRFGKSLKAQNIVTKFP